MENAAPTAPESLRPGPTAAALGLLVLSFVVFPLFGRYHATLPLHSGIDPVLAFLPRADVTPLLTYVWLLLHVFAFSYWIKFERARLPYLLASVALFMAVRNVFIVLTPVAPPEGMIPLYTEAWFAPLRGTIFFDNELFFSGHTGVPFLYFLLSRGESRVRWAFLAFSFLMGAGVLLTRNHYAMDVLGAYFMTYSIHRLGLFCFGGLDR